MKRLARKKSKRIPTKQRVKAEKKVREHNRKIRKERRKNPAKAAKKAWKNLSVPNDCPFKEEVLKEVEEAKRRKEAERAERRKKLANAGTVGKTKPMLAGVANETELRVEAEKKQARFQEEVSENEATGADSLSRDRSAKVHYKEFAKVVDAADVILEVLDARDPLGTRCKDVEKLVLGHSSKRLVLVLNKADLVPKENLEAWIKYLRCELPAVAFKSSTQLQSRHLGHVSAKMSKLSSVDIKTSKSVGVTTLMTLLGNYQRNKDVKTAIRVGVVGYPNVGKSSLINSLKRGKVCKTGNVPGVTRVVQEIQLDKKITLLDSPGLVLQSPSDGAESDVQIALRNAMKVDQLSDVMTPVEAILQRCEKQYLQLQYNLPSFSTTEEFLQLLAQDFGKLKKGGVADTDAAARRVINDWNNGKIQYHSFPPQERQEGSDLKLVTEFAKEFSLDDLDDLMEQD